MENETKYVYFQMNGFEYRTNGVIVEGKDGKTWNKTSSLSVVLAGRDMYKAANNG